MKDIFYKYFVNEYILIPIYILLHILLHDAYVLRIYLSKDIVYLSIMIFSVICISQQKYVSRYQILKYIILTLLMALVFLELYKQYFFTLGQEFIILLTMKGIPGLLKYHLSKIVIFISLLIFIIVSYLKICKIKLIKCNISILFYIFLIIQITYIIMHRYKGIFDYIEMNRWLNYEEIPIENYAKVGAKYEIITEEELEVTRGKNLVHIILESTENNFADNSLFPNLLPTIDNIKSKSVLFDNMDMCENATLTFGGMYAAYTGKWLSSVFGYGNKYNLKYNSIMSFPQILQKAKYNQVFTYAHINAFSGFKEYLQYIGFDVHQYAIESIKGISEMYKSDTFLFQKAYEDFEKLASKDNPFNLTILTIDAHAPDGLTYKDTKKYIGGQKNKLLDAIHTTDNALGDFLEKIKKHKSYKDTIIVIQSDHLAHPFTTKDILQKLQEKDRKMLFLIANTDFRSEVNHSASKTFDIAPTILEAMKVKHNAVFLFGENLFNEKQTPNRLKYNVDQERINLDYDKRVSKM